MSSTTQTDSKTKAAGKTATPSTALDEKRKQRKTSRKARRVTLKEKINKDAEFKKTYFEGKSTRSEARVSAFKKLKKGKK